MAFKERIFRRHRADGAVQTGDEPPVQAEGDPSQPDVTPEPDAPVADRRRRPRPPPTASRSRPRPDRRDARPSQAKRSPPAWAGPGFRARGQMRRRLRYLREVRELGFRDLGGLVFDQHRFGRPNEALVQGKVGAIDATDRETRALEAALDERKPYSELFVAGVSACQRCGGLHGSDARFCPSCGLASAGRERSPASAPSTTPRRGRRSAGPARGVRARARGAGAVRAARAGRTRRRGPRSARGPGSVSAVAGGDPAYAAPPDGSLPCGRCGELLAPDQDWCLRCGDPARTVIAPTPRWRRPLLALGAFVLLALGVLTAAFISLTDDDPPPARTVTSTITTQPGDALPPGVTPAPGAASGATGPATSPARRHRRRRHRRRPRRRPFPATTDSLIPDTEAGDEPGTAARGGGRHPTARRARSPSDRPAPAIHDPAPGDFRPGAGPAPAARRPRPPATRGRRDRARAPRRPPRASPAATRTARRGRSRPRARCRAAPRARPRAARMLAAIRP